MNLVWKLLRQHISISQFMGFFLANLVGLTIVMLGIQFYSDIMSVYEAEDNFMKADYLVLHKEVGELTALTGETKYFSKEELNDIKAQPFVEKVGVFTSSSFSVRTTFELEKIVSFSTDMFFESVPDDFIDVKSNEWNFVEGQKEIPIILPRNYLDLYNFGYAQSKSLPKLSEGVLGALNLKLRLSGTYSQDEYSGRVVGFSNRLNTILVPQKFMSWANPHYGANSNDDNLQVASRLIVQVKNPADENIMSYLQNNGYETDIEKLDVSKTTFILKIVVGIVMSVGLVICALAFYILMLSVFLLVEKNMSKLENLLLLGYSPARVSMPYVYLTLGLNILVFVLALVIMLATRQYYIELLESYFPNVDIPNSDLALLFGSVLLVTVSGFNYIAIRSKINSIWKKKD